MSHLRVVLSAKLFALVLFVVTRAAAETSANFNTMAFYPKTHQQEAGVSLSVRHSSVGL